MKRKKYNLLVVLIFSAILFSSLPILAISSATVQVTPGVQMIPLATSFYSEDFTNDSLEDTLISTAPGWGTGVVTNQRQLSISLLDFYNTSTNIVDVAVQGRKVYATGYSIGASTDTLFCFNITDPSNIEYMSDRDSGVGFLTGTVQGDVHYIGADLVSSGWIGVYNVTNPNTFDQPVTFITGFFPDGPVTDLEVRGHFLFGTVYNSTSSRGLIVYDVEDPYNIQQITNTIAFDHAMGLDVAGQYAYVCDGPNGLYVLNVSFPYGIPNPIGSVNTPGTATDILVDGHLGILADGPEGVHLIDLRNPSNPTIIGSINTTGTARRLALQENTLFVADGAGGVSIIDITVPYHPQLVAEIALSYTWDVDLYGGTLVVGTDDGVHTFQTGLGLTGLPVVASIAGGYEYWDSRVVGNIAYVAGGRNGTFIFNVQDPSSPVLLNHTTYGGMADIRTLEVEGHYLHTADFYSNIWVFDVSDPADPQFVARWGGNDAVDLQIVSGVAFIAASGAGLHIWNVTNPAMAFAITGGPMGNVTCLQVQGPHLYVGIDTAGIGSGLQIYDISILSAPQLTGQFFFESYTYDIFVDGDVLYMADRDWPIIWNVTDPFSPIFNFASGWLNGENVIGVAGFGPNFFSTNGSSGLALVDGQDINDIDYVDGAPSVTGGRRITVQGDYAYIASSDSFDIVHIFRSAAGTYQTGTDASQSLTVSDTTDLIVNATLDFSAYVPTGTSISFALSADGGLHWEVVTPGVEHVFTYPGSDLRWSANLSTSQPDASAHLYGVSISYIHNPLLPFGLPFELLIALIAAIIIIIIVILVIMLLRRRKSREQ